MPTSEKRSPAQMVSPSLVSVVYMGLPVSSTSSWHTSLPSTALVVTVSFCAKKRFKNA
jgi:hypothetical protein